MRQGTWPDLHLKGREDFAGQLWGVPPWLSRSSSRGEYSAPRGAVGHAGQ